MKPDCYVKEGRLFVLQRDGLPAWSGPEVGLLWDEQSRTLLGHGDPVSLHAQLATYEGLGVMAISAAWDVADLQRVLADHTSLRYLPLGHAAIHRRERDPLELDLEDFARQRLLPATTRRRHEITGTVRSIIFSREGYVILSASTPTGDRFTAAGNAPDGATVGSTYVFLGRWTTHSTHGERFSFDTLARDLPATREGVLAYFRTTLHNIGFGPRAGQTLWGQYGHASLARLLEDPSSVAHATGLKLSVLERAREIILADVDTLRTRVALYSLLAGRGFPGSIIQTCLDIWGAAAPEEIRRQPFVLLQRHLPGVGFDRVDTLYRDLALPPLDATRQAWCAWHAVADDRQGNTWLRRMQVRSHLMDKLGRDAQPEQAITHALSQHLLVLRRQGSEDWLTTPARATAEATLVERANILSSSAPCHWPDPALLPGLTPHQREQLALALRGRFSLLAGSPGTGKSTCAMALVQHLIASGLSVGIAAPTGKAAVRCTEILRGLGIDASATTIHRLLGVVPLESGWTFQYGPDNRLPYDILLGDEQSMTDLDLMATWLAACRDDAHVLLVGDPHQLPPVGHGAPFRDLLSSGLPVGTLTHIHRLEGGGASRIAVACAAIRDRQPVVVSPTFDPARGENLRHRPAATPADMILALRMLLQSLAKGSRYHPIDDIHVLCLVNDGTDVSRASLNPILQAELNPAGHTLPNHPYRVGDKIICLRNGSRTSVGPPELPGRLFEASAWQPILDDEGEREVEFIANGDVGRVLALSPLSLVARFPSPDRVVSISLQNEDEFDLGYITTVHRFQGSEQKVVVFMIDSSPKAARVASRELVYTALSRARELCILIGDLNTLQAWCKRASLPGRQTLVQPLLAEILC